MMIFGTDYLQHTKILYLRSINWKVFDPTISKIQPMLFHRIKCLQNISKKGNSWVIHVGECISLPIWPICESLRN